ncbi:MAG: hypothetical protein N838_05510 [Thiohalocapsa sp. PB-PSB1]|jgi:heat shock protein HslJ|nr:MAG: hypothetical protein N838_05510 [Thiohalocapsa sp. PB-PSB1]
MSSRAKIEDQPMPSIRLFVSSITLLAVSTVLAAESAFRTHDEAAFTAQGNEPGWSLRMTETKIRLNLDYGARTIEARRPKAIIEDNATRYRVPDEDVRITVREQRCHDDMSGMPYPLRVEIKVEGRELRGCGGEPRALLEGSAWTLSSLKGEALPEAVSITIQFLENNRIAGNSGCNRFMGGYVLTGEGLSFSQLGGTMMACPEPQMQVEQQFLDLMAEVIGFDLSADGALLLKTAVGTQLTARR